MNKKYCVVFATRNYYPMFEGFLYKYTKADWDDVTLLNVDVSSLPDEKEKGKKTCEKLGIHFVNQGDENYTSTQSVIEAADIYLTKNNIDVDWIIYFEHDVVPLQKDFWERLDKLLDNDKFIDNVGMFGANCYQWIGYDEASKLVNSDDWFKKRSTGTATARGNLVNGIMNLHHPGWYCGLPKDYYKSDYFVVEVPNWTCTGFNRKLFRENIKVDTRFKFDLWADDIAHQFLLKGFVNITFPSLMVCHTHEFKNEVSIVSDQNFIRNTNSHDVFYSKYSIYWGKRNTMLRQQFENAAYNWWDDNKMYKNSIQKLLFEMNITDGPKKIEDFINV